LRDDVVLAERVAIEDLPAYYAGAECLVLPSLHEGFGLPALEAMACGCPVVVSNVTALPEVVGAARLLIDPTDPQAIPDAVAAVVDDRGLRDDLRKRGLARAAGFRWERAAAETVVYERV
jgi:glycosyltransferase involved in cell wall biosynthesis